MNRQEAYKFLAEYVDRNYDPDCDYDEFCRAMECINRLAPPTPDPDTGLVPCGCGGKAKIWPSSLRQDMTTDYAVVCTECAIVTGWVRGKQENAVKVWNTAMGWKGDAAQRGEGTSHV